MTEKTAGDATILTANSMRKFTPAATTTRKYMADMPSAKPERAMVSLIKSAPRIDDGRGGCRRKRSRIGVFFCKSLVDEPRGNARRRPLNEH